MTAVNDVLFPVLSEAWPAAITDTLPLVHVKAEERFESCSLGVGAGREEGKEEKEKTWEASQRQGVVLGVKGWTDRSKAHTYPIAWLSRRRS